MQDKPRVASAVLCIMGLAVKNQRGEAPDNNEPINLMIN